MVIDIRDYTPDSQDWIFFDNNIWMFLFCPLGNYREQKQTAYSSFFERCLSANTKILICSLICSEFANAYLRLDFSQWKNRTGNTGAHFKRDYQRTEEYRTTAEEVDAQLRTILRLSSRVNDHFRELELMRITSRLPLIDFNDSYYLELADSQGYKILTDDRDFRIDLGQRCDILTLTSR